MPKQESIEVEGVVVEPLPNAMFRVGVERWGIWFWLISLGR